MIDKKTITSKKVFKMLEVFDVLPNGILENRRKFNMYDGCVYEKKRFENGDCYFGDRYLPPLIPEHGCGTVHCFAGWYLVAKHFSEIRDGKFVSGPFKDKGQVDFKSGIKAIHEHFFPNADNTLFDPDAGEYTYRIFMSFNGDIWGNSYKTGMFHYSDAFTPRNKSRADTLQDVLDHWGEVGLRLYIEELYDEGEKEC